MTRLLTLVALSLAMACTPAIGEARSKRIHVTAKIVEQRSSAIRPSPKIGDQTINTVELLDKDNERGRHWRGNLHACHPPRTLGLDALVQCFITAIV